MPAISVLRTGCLRLVKPLGSETLRHMKGVRTRATLEHHVAC